MLCLQCLPRPDAAAAMAVGDAAGGETAAAISQPGAADAMLLDAVGGGGAVDALLPNPPPEAAAALGTPADLQFLAGKLRDVCTGTDELTARVRAVLAAGAGAGLGGGAAGASDGSVRGVPLGGESYMDACDCVDLLNRQLKAYLASL